MRLLTIPCLNSLFKRYVVEELFPLLSVMKHAPSAEQVVGDEAGGLQPSVHV